MRAIRLLILPALLLALAGCVAYPAGGYYGGGGGYYYAPAPAYYGLYISPGWWGGWHGGGDRGWRR